MMRQIVVCCGIWIAFFTTGLCVGAPTVTIPQLRREANSTMAVSEEMASWISSVHGYAALPWFIIPLASGRFGRKYPFLAVSGISLISYILFYYSSTPKHILITEILQGPIFACHLTISIIIVIEYTSPKYRGLFLTLKSASGNWGIWVANALGTFFHWRTIAVAGIICSLFNLLTTLYWCESPSWLASKNRFEECARAHRWIKGEDAESERELAALIKSCKENQEKQNRDNLKTKKFWKRFYETMIDKAFYKPTLLNIAVVILLYSSGKLVCNVYAIDIIKKMTSDESTAYRGMLFLDGVIVISMYIGCGLSKFVKRRILLFTGSLGGVLFLFVLALYLFLVKLKVLGENAYISIGLIGMFFIFISIGPLILGSSLYGELMPLRYRTVGMFLVGICVEINLATALKTAPQVFKTFGMHGAFLFYGIICLVFTLFLYKYLPETKDKTLQEIEKCLVGKIKTDKSAETQPMFN